METKVCSKCGRELPRSEYYASTRSCDGLQSQCKDCIKENSRQRYERAKSNLRVSTLPPATDLYFDERLKGITPRELIEELQKRGYTGTLEYREVRVHKINL